MMPKLAALQGGIIVNLKSITIAFILPSVNFGQNFFTLRLFVYEFRHETFMLQIPLHIPRVLEISSFLL